MLQHIQILAFEHFDLMAKLPKEPSSPYRDQQTRTPAKKELSHCLGNTQLQWPLLIVLISPAVLTILPANMLTPQSLRLAA